MATLNIFNIIILLTCLSQNTYIHVISAARRFPALMVNFLHGVVSKNITIRAANLAASGTLVWNQHKSSCAESGIFFHETYTINFEL